MFVGREKELQKLNDLYRSDRFEFAVIYGRRRVGKTTLINEFVKDKDTIYFTALETSAQDNLENLSQSIFSIEKEEQTAPVFKNFKDALNAIDEKAKEKRIVLVIDEFPYLAYSYSTISSLLQVQIDQRFKRSKLFLILCGSSMSFMENQVLGYKSPLYGRRTVQFKINPFDFYETCAYFHRFKQIEIAQIFGMTGGVPQYLEHIDENCSLEDNIKSNYLSSSAYFFEEPSNLLKQEVREPALYNAIITAIATGSSKNNEIATKVGMETGALATYLNNLISLGIVKKEHPINEPSVRKTIYSIEDHMFRFWYRFIPHNASLIQRGNTEIAYQKIEGQISEFMGKVFEDICKQWLWRENTKGTLPVLFTEVGRWWGNNPEKRSEAEIDLLALDGKESAIFGECKWTNERVGAELIDKLVTLSNLFHFKKKYYYLFAKTGFTKGCIEKAERMGNVTLIKFANMK